MNAPSEQYKRQIVEMFDSFCKTVSRNYSRNLKRAKRNHDKHFTQEPVELLLELWGEWDEYSPLVRYVSPLPEKPLYQMPLQGIHYFSDWPIRVNVEHILGDPANMERLPAEIRNNRNLPLLLETAVELARRQATITPGIVVPQVYQQRVQFLLPLCLQNMEQPDLAMTLRPMDGYYMGYTCLTLQMAYANARLLARPTAPWLLSLVE